MKAIVLCALALVLANAASAATDDNDACIFEPHLDANTSEYVNLNGVSFNGTVVVESGHTLRPYKLLFSPCKTATFPNNCTGFAYVSRGAQSSCFDTAPNTTQYNTTNNGTSFTFGAKSNTQNSLMALLMDEAKVDNLMTTFSCNEEFNKPDERENLHPIQRESSVNGNTLNIRFQTGAACPLVIPDTPVPNATTPVPNATTPAPIAGGGDDDNSGLSTWAIVGIIAGCVVVIVIGVLAFFHCRKSDASAEGQYSRV